MTTRDQERSARPHRPVLGIVMLAALAILAALVGPGLVNRLVSTDLGLLGSGPACAVQTADGEVGLDRDQAQRATTAVALAARDAADVPDLTDTTDTTDTTDIDDAVLQRLAEGPPGDAGPSLTCRGSIASNLPEQEISSTGLTPRAEQLREEMTAVFGDQELGGFAPGGVERAGESTHNDGRAIDIFFRPVTEENRRQGWLLAHWLVAHAEELDIQFVIFDDRVWSPRSSRGRWQDYDAPTPGNEILRHLDHVHVDVLRGESR